MKEINISKLISDPANINKDHIIKLQDVELTLPKVVIEARTYQYNLI